MNINYRKTNINDLKVVTDLTLILYGESDFEYMEKENVGLLNNENQAIFLAFVEDNHIGFANCSLRSDYVEGTNGGTIGFLEGVFVAPKYRKMGIAKELVNICEQWAKGKGCTEFASDCQLDNTDSYNFHMKIGFAEVNRIICFTKKL